MGRSTRLRWRSAGTRIEDTFAEAFRMRYVAADRHGARRALARRRGPRVHRLQLVDHLLRRRDRARAAAAGERNARRPARGAACWSSAFRADALATVVPNRTGQCLMTCPTTAVYDGLTEGEERIPLGKTIRYFGDGFQKSKLHRRPPLSGACR